MSTAKRPPINTLDQSTLDLIANPPACDSPENRKAVMLAALDVAYTVFRALWDNDPDQIIYELISDRFRFEDHGSGSEEGADYDFWKIVSAAIDYQRSHKGCIGPAFTTSWWTDKKQIPPELARVITGEPSRLEKAMGGELIKAKPSPIVKGPSAALVAHEDDLWGDDDDEEGGDDG